MGTMSEAAQTVRSAAEPLLALAKKPEHKARAEKAAQQADSAMQAARVLPPAFSSAREQLEMASEARDVEKLVLACGALKGIVGQATSAAGAAFQASQLAQHAAPAVSTQGKVAAPTTYIVGGKSAKQNNSMPGPPRETLPIDEHQEAIVRAVRERRVVCIQGETGCGKSSRVPQYVHYFCRDRKDVERFGGERTIVCTQPRRLAALTLAQRVANEMGESTVGGLVGYKIGGDAAFDLRRTKLLFVTTGYLLQVLVNDPSQIRRFSHLILDEAHERSVDADLVSLVLKLILQHKMADFRIIVMSATLQGGIFSKYFRAEGDTQDPPPPIFVGVKRFALDVMYLDDLSSLGIRLNRDDMALSTLDQLRQKSELALTNLGTSAINGGIEAFAKSVNQNQRQAQANPLAATQAAALAMVGRESVESEFWRINADGSGSKTSALLKNNFMKPQIVRGLEHVVLELVRVLGCGGEGILVFLPGIGEISEVFDVLAILEASPEEQVAAGLTGNRRFPCKYRIFVLHSTIPMDEQEEAFHQPPDNVCHIFLASTIAESSVTLPKVRVVIDFCLRRQLAHDRNRHGMNCLMTQWVSHASAAQRSGRAGRVFPGVAIRMVPRSFYTAAMPQYDPPEIVDAPLEKLYLNVKQLSQRLRERLPRIGALPPRRLLQLTVQPPPAENIEEAVGTLWELGALTSRSDETAQITILGRLAIALPLELRLCRLVLLGVLLGCPADAVVMAAALSSQDPFSMPLQMVIKDHYKYLRGVLRSSESRRMLDGGTLSEPIMLRNLFLEWLSGLRFDDAAKGAAASSHSAGRSGATQRNVFVKHSHSMLQKHAVMPKRLTQLALLVADVAQRTLEFVEPAPENAPSDVTPARRSLEGLLAHLGVQKQNKRDKEGGLEAEKIPMMRTEKPKLEDVFCLDLFVMLTTIVGAFSPLYAHGIVRCTDYKSTIAGPPRAVAAGGGPAEQTAEGETVMVSATPQTVPADPHLAKLMQTMLQEASLGGPHRCFCIPGVPEALQQSEELWAQSLKDYTNMGKAKFQKLQILQGSAFVCYDETGMASDDEESGTSEQEEAVMFLEELARKYGNRDIPGIQAYEDEEGIEGDVGENDAEKSDDEPVRQRAESSDSNSVDSEEIARRRKKAAKKKRQAVEASAADNGQGDSAEATGEQGQNKIQIKLSTTKEQLKRKADNEEAGSEDSKASHGEDEEGGAASKKDKSQKNKQRKTKKSRKDDKDSGKKAKKRKERDASGSDRSSSSGHEEESGQETAAAAEGRRIAAAAAALGLNKPEAGEEPKKAKKSVNAAFEGGKQEKAEASKRKAGGINMLKINSTQGGGGGSGGSVLARLQAQKEREEEAKQLREKKAAEKDGQGKKAASKVAAEEEKEGGKRDASPDAETEDDKEPAPSTAKKRRTSEKADKQDAEPKDGGEGAETSAKDKSSKKKDKKKKAKKKKRSDSPRSKDEAATEEAKEEPQKDKEEEAKQAKESAAAPSEQSEEKKAEEATEGEAAEDGDDEMDDAEACDAEASDEDGSAPVAKKSRSDAFQPGELVKLRGLGSRKDLNGARGVIDISVAMKIASGKVRVRVGSESISVGVNNIIREAAKGKPASKKARVAERSRSRDPEPPPPPAGTGGTVPADDEKTKAAATEAQEEEKKAEAEAEQKPVKKKKLVKLTAACEESENSDSEEVKLFTDTKKAKTADSKHSKETEKSATKEGVDAGGDDLMADFLNELGGLQGDAVAEDSKEDAEGGEELKQSPAGAAEKDAKAKEGEKQEQEKDSKPAAGEAEDAATDYENDESGDKEKAKELEVESEAAAAEKEEAPRPNSEEKKDADEASAADSGEAKPGSEEESERKKNDEEPSEAKKGEEEASKPTPSEQEKAEQANKQDTDQIGDKGEEAKEADEASEDKASKDKDAGDQVDEDDVDKLLDDALEKENKDDGNTEDAKAPTDGDKADSTPEEDAAPEKDDKVPGKEKDWEDMRDKEKDAVLKLGWTEASWTDGDAAPFQRTWQSLAKEEKEAARHLGLADEDFLTEEAPASKGRRNCFDVAPLEAKEADGKAASETKTAKPRNALDVPEGAKKKSKADVRKDVKKEPKPVPQTEEEIAFAKFLAELEAAAKEAEVRGLLQQSASPEDAAKEEESKTDAAEKEEEEEPSVELLRLPIEELKRRAQDLSRAADDAQLPEDKYELVAMLLQDGTYGGDEVEKDTDEAGRDADADFAAFLAELGGGSLQEEEATAAEDDVARGSPPAADDDSAAKAEAASGASGVAGKAATSTAGGPEAFDAFLQELDMIPGMDADPAPPPPPPQEPDTPQAPEEPPPAPPPQACTATKEAASTAGTTAVAPEAASAVVAELPVEATPVAAVVPAQPPQTVPVLLRFDEKQPAWVVSLAHGLGIRRFPAGLDAVHAYREALRYCHEKMQAFETGNLTSAEEDEEREKARRAAMATSDSEALVSIFLHKPLRKNCLDMPFRAMHLLHQFAGGKGTFAWPLRSKQRMMPGQMGKDFSAEIEQRYDLQRPLHPFQLHFRVCLERGLPVEERPDAAPRSSITFGAGNFRNPVGLVISRPSRRRIKKLQEWASQNLAKNAAAVREIQQKHQKALTLAMTQVQAPAQAYQVMQQLNQEAQKELASVASAAAAGTGQWTRRLERMAVFCGCQGREDVRGGNLQLEGLTVIPNEGGSNALPIALVLAFMRPYTVGAMRQGGCSVLCDLDDMRIRAVSLFGHSDESRWILPVCGKRRLYLQDLQRVNKLRQAISSTFEGIEAEEADEKPPQQLPLKEVATAEISAEREAAPAPGGRAKGGGHAVIRERPEICRLLGELIADLGRAPHAFNDPGIAADGVSDPKQALQADGGAESGNGASEAAAAEAAEALSRMSLPNAAPEVAEGARDKQAQTPAAPEPKAETASSGQQPRRELGDHWIDIGEDGFNAEVAGFMRWDSLGAEAQNAEEAAEERAAAAGFLSFDTPLEEQARKAADAKKEADEKAAAAKKEAVDAARLAAEKAREEKLKFGRKEAANFCFLPQLNVAASIEAKAERLKQMKVDATQLVAAAHADAKESGQQFRALKESAKQIDMAMESARHAWNRAWHATTPPEVQKALERALRTIDELHNAAGDMTESARAIEEAHRRALEREQQAVKGHNEVPHFWKAALGVARSARSKRGNQWTAAANLFQNAEISKRTAYRKADETVQLVNEKTRRWQDERQILEEEVREAELERQMEAYKQQQAVYAAQREAQLELQRQQFEIQRQQEEAARRRMEAIQWGRQFVVPVPGLQYGAQPGASATTVPANMVPPPPSDEPPPPPPMMPGDAAFAAPPPPPDEAAAFPRPPAY
eukprot:TRINITY_DN10892_c0_g1_i2.p1 TRINITY_DN10892_c0_g1~~TRINITY_DN10892_c0_g1_i2.p1  ORF type:complete len:3538 (+),score=1283.55 TRINITY_DN10892_c0_g1_i2:605-10615(+)